MGVLLINADSATHRQVAEACTRLGTPLLQAEGLAAAQQALENGGIDVAIIHLARAEPEGLALFNALHERWPRLCMMLIAGRSRSDQAIEAMKRGAVDYLLKPLKAGELVGKLENALRLSRDMQVPAVFDRPRESAGDRIIGESPAMHEVFKLIGLIAPRDVNVLITGESGTGKELVARALYHHSRRKDRPFLAVNCAAIPETLLESELFGHEKGAFTGADSRRIGKFEQCNGGTLLLDEIGDLPLTTQAKLLRVLQDGSFQRLGGTQTIHVDVRILAATNQPLEQLIAERKFRQDLYYRLKVTTIELPPLREREVDAVLLAHHFVQRLNPSMGTQIRRFSPDVLPVLLSYPWPGNVRELENVIKASLVVARGSVFQLDFLPELIRHYPRTGRPADIEPALPAGPPPAREMAGESLRDLCRAMAQRKELHGQLYARATEAAEREIIQACLEQSRGRLASAARLLGISRTTLRRRMAELGLEVVTQVQPANE